MNKTSFTNHYSWLQGDSQSTPVLNPSRSTLEAIRFQSLGKPSLSPREHLSWHDSGVNKPESPVVPTPWKMTFDTKNVYLIWMRRDGDTVIY